MAEAKKKAPEKPAKLAEQKVQKKKTPRAEGGSPPPQAEGGAPPVEQFMNTNDWPLWRWKELFRVKALDEDGSEYQLVSSEDPEKVYSLKEEELYELMEPVKGLHKREF